MRVYEYLVYDRDSQQATEPIAMFALESDARDFIRRCKSGTGQMLLMDTVKRKAYGYLKNTFVEIPK